MPSIEPAAVCADCGIGPVPDTDNTNNTTATVSSPLLNVRRRLLCQSCFTRYVNSKIVKRMELYRFKNQETDEDSQQQKPRLLLPLSGGVSGVALLLALEAQLKRQFEKRKRTAYDLILVHVFGLGSGSGSESESTETRGWRDRVQIQFPNHEFLPVVNFDDVLQYDKMLEADLKELGMIRNQHQDSREVVEDDKSLITRLFISTRTPTARADLHELLLRRLLVAIAKEHGCEGILWAHSDSRLAAKALADVATGRGGSVSSALTDGTSPWGLSSNYPVRELYRSELLLYLEAQDGEFGHCLLEDVKQPATGDAGAPVSIRHTAISDLLTGYISSQGEKYPGIMANVVRTTGKLQAPALSKDQRCKLCSMQTTIPESVLCYGCVRMKQDIKL